MDNSIMGLGALTSDYWKSNTQTKELEKSLSSDMSGKTEEELMEVCKDFESYFVEQMFKSMKKMIPESEDSNNDYINMFGDMLVQKYAESATEQQGLGIAQKLYEQMKRNYGLQ